MEVADYLVEVRALRTFGDRLFALTLEPWFDDAKQRVALLLSQQNESRGALVRLYGTIIA